MVSESLSAIPAKVSEPAQREEELHCEALSFDMLQCTYVGCAPFVSVTKTRLFLRGCTSRMFGWTER